MKSTKLTIIMVIALGVGVLGAVSRFADEAHAQLGASRTHAQNFKDMLLARCLANAYQADAPAANDASSSADMLFEWTDYDVERATDEITVLIDTYRRKNYQHPLVEYKGVSFELLKCLDMYHSSEAATLLKRYVRGPKRTHSQASRHAVSN